MDTEKLNLQKYKAQTAIQNAIKSGKLVRKPCEVCGDEKSEAHHDDYYKPIDVRWLCRTHHRQYHEKLWKKNNETSQHPRLKRGEYKKDLDKMMSIRLTPLALAKLDAIAKDEGVTRSEALRRVLEQYIGIPVVGKIKDGRISDGA